MSHYCKVDTQIVDQEMLLKALAEFGYTNVEVHEVAKNLYGYQGDLRPEKANVIIRRKHISAASNDIGFRLTGNGTYEAIISEYDQQILGADWVDKISQAYAYHGVVENLTKQGFAVSERKVDPQTKKIHLVLRRSR